MIGWMELTELTFERTCRFVISHDLIVKATVVLHLPGLMASRLGIAGRKTLSVRYCSIGTLRGVPQITGVETPVFYRTTLSESRVSWRASPKPLPSSRPIIPSIHLPRMANKERRWKDTLSYRGVVRTDCDPKRWCLVYPIVTPAFAAL